MKDEPILELKHVRKVFKTRTGEISAVQDMSFQVYPGECIGIVGESGCGKSTLARMITHLESCTEGEIILNGQNITQIKGRKISEIYRDIQMVFQDPYAVFSPRTLIGTFLEDGLVYHGIMKREEAHAEAKKLLALVELPEEFMNRMPHQLSGGQLQRIVIARVISIRPKLIILDEATSALDVSVQKQILKLLMKLREEYHPTYVFIGHDLGVVRSVTNRIIIMYAGRIVESINSEELQKVVHPYSKRLLNSIFSLRDRGHKKLSLDMNSIVEQGKINAGCVYQSRCPYASERCFKELPPLQEVSENHAVYCFETKNIPNQIHRFFHTT